MDRGLVSDEQSKFLKASDPDTWAKPEDKTWGDWMLAPNKPLSDRHRELARMCAHGKQNKDICATLNYTEARVSVLRSNPKIREEINRYRDKLFGADVQTRLKEMSGDALNVMGDILTDSNMDLADKEAAAKWVLEKITGKPAQQLDVRSEVAIGIFMDKLDRVNTLKGLPLPQEVIDIVPKETTEKNKEEPTESNKGFSNWLDQNS